MTNPGRILLETWAPEATSALAEVERVALRTVDAHTLDLIRDRVDALLGGAPSPLDGWRDSTDLTDRDRALLTFVEQFVFSVSSMGDEEVASLLSHEDPVRLHEISNVVWALDLTTRLDRVAAVVLR